MLRRPQTFLRLKEDFADHMIRNSDLVKQTRQTKDGRTDDDDDGVRADHKIPQLMNCN